MAAKRHKDVGYHVDRADGVTLVMRSFDEAAGLAIAIAASTGAPVHLDVVIWSEAGARAYGGDDAVEQYREDPDASVFERLVIRCEDLGRVA